MDKTTGTRKRQQISSASRMMFIWIAAVSVVVGFCIVLMVFLVQRILFGERVIAEKQKTVSVLQKNLDNVQALKDNVRVLNTNEALQTTRLSDSDPGIQSVLDALPGEANPTSMAASLQTKLIGGIAGVTIESLKVDSTQDQSLASSDATDISSNKIGFSFSISSAAGNQTGLRQVLLNLEKSIRPFNITTLSIESQGQNIVMTATGFGYYDPAQTIQPSKKVVK